MKIEVINLNDEQVGDIESRLEKYDENHITYKVSGGISVGIMADGILIAGADGCMTAFRILYVSTVFVDEQYRGMGIGRRLMEAVEEKAAALGANMIRLDTFDWQGAKFYEKLGYERVGHYTNEIDGFSEYFYLKRL